VRKLLLYQYELLLNTYAYMHFWQNNTKLWDWNWLSLASLFIITNDSGQIFSEMQRSLGAGCCNDMSSLQSHLGSWWPGAGFPCVCIFIGSPPDPKSRAGCQQKEIKLSRASIFVFTYSLSKPTQILPLTENKSTLGLTCLPHQGHPEAD
jgi:hypothetical protein